MSVNKTIVTYRQLSQAVEKVGFPDTAVGLESVVSGPTPEQRDEINSQLLKALTVIRTAEGKGAPGVLVSPDHRFASLLQSYLAERATESLKVDSLETGGLEAKFDEQDWLGWAGSFFTWWTVRGAKPHQWIGNPGKTQQFPNKARVALLSDWGSGMYGAPACARSIERDHARYVSKNQSGYGALIHLGDVYYSGTVNEVQRQFLDQWPHIAGVISRACNSNHEMYTGGHAYFDLTLKQFGQVASYFAIANDHWVVAGLDSAYHDPDWRYEKALLSADQVAWLSRLIEEVGSRKIILLSHHQPFSVFERDNEALVRALQPFLAGKKIFAWYWGHEHRCVLHERHPGWGLFGRCIGHGGYPYFRDDFGAAPVEGRGPQDTVWRKVASTRPNVPEALVLDGPNPYIPGYEKQYGPHGYFTLAFDGGHLTESVHLPDGTVIREAQLA